MIKERNGGIELLRLVLMFMICIMHVLEKGGVIVNSTSDLSKYSVFWFMEIFSYCAVDAFALISGFVATNKPCKYEKLVNLWFKVFFYSFVITVFFVLIGKADNINILDIIKNALPIMFEKYWYMTAYFLLFLSTPILNSFLFKISKENAKIAFIIIVILFSFMGFISDPFKTFRGYSALWLIVLYCLGVLGNRIDIFGKIKSTTLICIWGLLTIFTWVSLVYYGIIKFVNYISPTVLFSGLIMVVLFKRIRIKSRFIINMASLSLGVYLLQLNQVIWNNVIENRFIFIVHKNLLSGVFYVLLISFIMWSLGLLVELVRSKLAKMLKIDLLCNKIVSSIKLFFKNVLFALE